MSDEILSDNDEEPSGEDGPRETRTWVEIFEPEDAKGTWRELGGSRSRARPRNC